MSLGQGMCDTMSGQDNSGRNGIVERKVSRDPQGTAKLDAVFDLLRSPRRRYLLYYLYSTDEEEVPLEAAIRGVQEFETAGPETATVELRQSIRTNLLHGDLPKLGSTGMLSWDTRRGTIQFTGDPLLRELLERSSYVELE